MIGSFGGEGGEFLLLFRRVEDHLNRRMKMKAKKLKTKGCSNKGSSFGPKNCRKCDLFFSLSRASICLSSWGIVLFYIGFTAQLPQWRSHLRIERGLGSHNFILFLKF